MVQNHLESILWTKYMGPTLWKRYLGPIPWVKIPRTKYHRPKPSFPTCTLFSLCESACICLRVFWYANPHVYTAWSEGTCVYLFFLHFVSLNCDLSFEWVAIKDNTCVIAPNLCHNANNLPLWTWWQPQTTLPFLHQGQRVMLPLSTCWILWYAKVCCPCSPWI